MSYLTNQYGCWFWATVDFVEMERQGAFRPEQPFLKWPAIKKTCFDKDSFRIGLS